MTNYVHIKYKAFSLILSLLILNIVLENYVNFNKINNFKYWIEYLIYMINSFYKNKILEYFIKYYHFFLFEINVNWTVMCSLILYKLKKNSNTTLFREKYFVIYSCN